MTRPIMLALRFSTLAALGGAACGGGASSRTPEPIDVSRRGAAERFGPGITHASARVLKYELIRPAHVIVLRVSSDGRVEPVFPERSGDQTQQNAGVHGLSVGDVATALREYRVEGAPAESKIGRFDPRPGASVAAGGAAGEAPVTYWMLIASDVPTTALQLQEFLRALKPAADLEALLDALPRALVGPRTTSWATYLTPAQER